MKKLIVIFFVLILSFTMVVSGTPPENEIEQDDNYTQEKEEVEIETYLKKDIPIESDIEFVRVIIPKENRVETSLDSFKFSALAPVDSNLAIWLLVYDEENEIYVPKKTEITESILDEDGQRKEQTYETDVIWEFGYSGYLGEEISLEKEGEYLYRFLVYNQDTKKEDFEYGENIQVYDISVTYKIVEDFNQKLYKNYWNIYFNSRDSFFNIFNNKADQETINPKVPVLPDIRMP